MHTCHENDGCAFKTGMSSNRSGDLEPIHPGHAHVEENCSNILREQPLESFRARQRALELETHTRENDLVRSETGRRVVDEQYGG